MAWLNRTSTNWLISLGALFTLVGLHAAVDETKLPAERRGDAAACFLLGVPMTAWGVQRTRQLHQQKRQQEHDRLRSLFFQLLRQNDAITPLQFAMTANISGAAAKQFLDQQAKEFDAEFEVDDRGTIRYRFNPGSSSPGLPGG